MQFMTDTEKQRRAKKERRDAKFRTVEDMYATKAFSGESGVLRGPAKITATSFSDAGGPCSSIQDGTGRRGCREPPFRHR